MLFRSLRVLLEVLPVQLALALLGAQLAGGQQAGEAAVGLAVGGENGVRDVIENLKADFDLAMALSGYDSVVKLDRSAVRSAGFQ